MPAENLVSPDTVRRVMWSPPAPEAEAVAAQLTSSAPAQWQVDLVTRCLVDAIVGAQPEG